MNEKLRVLDLFSGIGGFSLGLERAGMQTVAFCEIEPFCRAVLRKHWSDIPIFTDIRHLKFDASAKILYDDRYGQEKDMQTRSDGDVCGRVIGGRDSEFLRGKPPSDVGMVKGAASGDASAMEIWEGESFPQKRKNGQRQSAESFGNRDTTRDRQPQSNLREMRGDAGIQGRQEWDSGSSLRLQQASGGNVVVPKMPPRMAQDQQSNNEERRLNGVHAVKGTIDVICGGFP